MDILNSISALTHIYTTLFSATVFIFQVPSIRNSTTQSQQAPHTRWEQVLKTGILIQHPLGLQTQHTVIWTEIPYAGEQPDCTCPSKEHNTMGYHGKHYLVKLAWCLNLQHGYTCDVWKNFIVNSFQNKIILPYKVNPNCEDDSWKAAS